MIKYNEPIDVTKRTSMLIVSALAVMELEPDQELLLIDSLATLSMPCLGSV